MPARPALQLQTSDQGDQDTIAGYLAAILVELRALNATLRGRREAPALIAAIDSDLSDARFTASSLLQIADTEPRSAVASALGALIDLGASERSRATALGVLLANLLELERVAEHRGVAVYRLRT